MNEMLLQSFMNAADVGDWPQWLGPQRAGSSAETIEPWSETPPVISRMPVGTGFSSPVVAKPRVFIHARKGMSQEEVTVVDANTGYPTCRMECRSLEMVLN